MSCPRGPATKPSFFHTTGAFDKVHLSKYSDKYRTSSYSTVMATLRLGAFTDDSEDESPRPTARPINARVVWQAVGWRRDLSTLIVCG